MRPGAWPMKGRTERSNGAVWLVQGKAVNDPPASREEAERERLTLVDEMSDINAQLSTYKVGDPNYHEWHSKAVWAKRVREKRLIFLKQWLNDNWRANAKANRRPYTPGDGGASAVDTMFAIARRVAVLEDFYEAFGTYMTDDTDEAWEAVLGHYSRLQEHLAKSGGDDDA